MLRAATQQLLIRTPEDPYGFLVEWLYSVSTSAAELGSSTLTDEVTDAEMAERFDALSDVEEKLAGLRGMISADPFLTDARLQTTLGQLDQLMERTRAAQGK